MEDAKRKRVALITGGTRGLGAAIAIELKANNYQVISTYHGDQKSADTFSNKHEIEIKKFDVASYEGCQVALSEILSKNGHIDVLVNNAGIISDSSFVKLSIEAWQRVINVNLNSLFNVTKQVISGMIDSKYGRIINISSINGQMGAFGQTNYASSKAGVFGFTKSLALELAHKGITVNAVAPGYCDTDMMEGIDDRIMDKILAKIPIKRLAQPQEIAHAVVFLAAENSGYITGSTISVNGGQNML